MVEAFTCMEGNERMGYWQTRLVSGNLNILEVGAGVGIVGISLAALGGCVLITDLPVLVEHSIRPNLRRNRCNENVDDDNNFKRHCGRSTNHDNFFLESSEEYSSNGNGSAQAVVLDWFIPLSEQLPYATTSAVEVIIGCDCMWMSKLVEPLLEVVSTIFQHYLSNITSTTTTRTQPSFFFTYQRRNQSGVFIGLEELLARINQRGWNVDCVSWRTIYDKEEGNHELYLFEVTPANS